MICYATVQTDIAVGHFEFLKFEVAYGDLLQRKRWADTLDFCVEAFNRRMGTTAGQAVRVWTRYADCDEELATARRLEVYQVMRRIEQQFEAAYQMAA